MAYARSDPEAVAYVERLLDRAAALGRQLRRAFKIVDWPGP